MAMVTEPVARRGRVADLVDAVVGIDTHRDTHQVEIALPTGAPIAVCQISNDDAGFATLLAWIAEHTPGPRLVVAIEGTRSYGIGVARALTTAGLTVIEGEQPNRKARRGRGKSDAIDAHHAVLTALALDAARLPTPRADGDREALRILLGARDELVTTSTAQTNRLRAVRDSPGRRDGPHYPIAGTRSPSGGGPGGVPSPNGRPPSSSRPCGLSQPPRSGPFGTMPVGLISACTP